MTETPKLPTDTELLQRATQNALLNAKLAVILECVADCDPALAMGVIGIAQARTFRRLTEHHKIIDGPRKKLLMDRVLKDLEAKIRKFGFWVQPQPPAQDNAPKVETEKT